MSENKPTDNTIDLKCLEAGTIINIEVPAEIHNRLQIMLYSLPMPEDMDMSKFLEVVMKNDPKDTNVFNARTLLWLIAEIEAKAVAQNKIVLHKVDKTTGKSVEVDVK